MGDKDGESGLGETLIEGSGETYLVKREQLMSMMSLNENNSAEDRSNKLLEIGDTYGIVAGLVTN
jgi:hypothetical protein